MNGWPEGATKEEKLILAQVKRALDDANKILEKETILQKISGMTVEELTKRLIEGWRLVPPEPMKPGDLGKLLSAAWKSGLPERSTKEEET